MLLNYSCCQIILRSLSIYVLTKPLLNNARSTFSIFDNQISLPLKPHSDPLLNVDDKDL
jgi:hypothetical protein